MLQNPDFNCSKISVGVRGWARFWYFTGILDSWCLIVSVLYPPIQEEMGIRRNIARGPKGRGQYFSVFPSPLGLGGTIRTLCTWSCPPQARAIKLRIALVLVEWSHAGGGETNIDRGQYWLPSIWHMQYWPQNTIQCYYHTFDSLKTGNFVKFLQLSPSSAVLTHYFLFIFSALQL